MRWNVHTHWTLGTPLWGLSPLQNILIIKIITFLLYGLSFFFCKQSLLKYEVSKTAETSCFSKACWKKKSLTMAIADKLNIELAQSDHLRGCPWAYLCQLRSNCSHIFTQESLHIILAGIVVHCWFPCSTFPVWPVKVWLLDNIERTIFVTWFWCLERNPMSQLVPF